MHNWLAYFDQVREQRSFRLEAEEFIERLNARTPLTPTLRVLDFGCGFGFVARTLASRVAAVTMWDASPSMRRRAAASVAGLMNAHVLEEPPCAADGERFDLIIANSVIQYMTLTEFQGWLRAWKHLLADCGRIVIADILPVYLQSHRDMVDQVIFGVRRGFLVTALKEGVLESRRYWTMRHACPLTRFSRQELGVLADSAGLEVEFLSRNLTCRTARISVLLRGAVDSVPSHT